MKIVFLDADTVGDLTALKGLEKYGEFIAYGRSTAAEAMERVREADIALTNKVVFDHALIDAAPRLMLICVTATGVNNIDLEYAAQKGIAVRNVSDYSTESVAQITFMHIFDLVCHGPWWDTYVKNGSWQRSGLFTDISHGWMELCGRQMGIIGMGKIGRRVAEIASAFGMEVVYYSTSGTNHCSDYPALSLEELLSTSDIVSIHAPLNERTNNLIAASQLQLMKPNAMIINIGRGGIVNEADLAAAIDGGVIAGAALDVFTREPIPADHPFMRMQHPERLSLSPHVAWTSNRAMETLLQRTVANVEEFLKNC